ncbi:hypothetical protein NIA69_03310 [Gemmiger formicilis]|nr:hypothetical protein [Gemmiger formicilis]
MPGPYRAAVGKPYAVRNARGGVKTPPYGLTHLRVPTPYRAAVGMPLPSATPAEGSRPLPTD